MTDEIQSALKRVFDGHDLMAEEMRAAVCAIMDGRANDVEIAALLTALRLKAEAVSEIVGAAQAMRERVTRINSNRTGLLDTCGTGGDQLHTFNISTATAFVAAAAGVPVAKHGNRSVSSSSGSADLLEALGVNIDLAPQQVADCLDDLGIGFCYAPLLHGAMKFAAAVRQQLGFRTIFNLLGPLTNPAGAEYQLLGTNSTAAAEKLAQAVAELGVKRALVVCGADELDEVSLWGETTVYEVVGGDVSVGKWTAQTFGLSTCRVEQLRVESAEQSANMVRDVFAGVKGPAREIVVANAAAALIAAERSEDPQTAARMAADAIDSGQAAEICRRLVERSNV